jgi:hypothetical protein
MLDAFAWSDVEDKSAVGILAELLDVDAAVLATAVHVSGQAADLPFYKRWVLLKIIGRPNEYIDMPETVFALWADGKRPQLLDGSNEALYAANEDEGLKLKPEQVLDYIHYFLFVVRGDEGAFIPFEKAPKKVPAGSEAIAAMASPLVPAGTDEGGDYLYKGKIIYGTALFEATFSVDVGGQMSMLDDEPLAADVPAELIPSAPELRDGSWLLANLPPEATEAMSTEPEPEAIDAVKVVKIGRERGARGKLRGASRKATPVAAKPVIELMVELLLEHALTNLSRNRLIDHFNERSPAKDTLDRFAALMVDASPVIVVETTIPYVERVIARIVDHRTTVRIQMCEGQ